MELGVVCYGLEPQGLAVDFQDGCGALRTLSISDPARLPGWQDGCLPQPVAPPHDAFLHRASPSFSLQDAGSVLDSASGPRTNLAALGRCLAAPSAPLQGDGWLR